jgi:hypothetical protein
VALVVGRRSRVDCRLVKPAWSTWRATFRRLLEGELAASPSCFLCLPRPPLSIPWLPLPVACGDCWRSSAWLGEAGGGRWASSASLVKPICEGWPSWARICAWRNYISVLNRAIRAAYFVVRGRSPSRARGTPPILGRCPIGLTGLQAIRKGMVMGLALRLYLRRGRVG